MGDSALIKPKNSDGSEDIFVKKKLLYILLVLFLLVTGCAGCAGCAGGTGGVRSAGNMGAVITGGSERVNQTLRVMREVKDEVYRKALLNDPVGVTRRDFDSIVVEAANRTAGRLGIDNSTCADKLTRQMGMKMKDFKNALWDFFTNDTPSEQTMLGSRILSRITTKDNSQVVRNRLDSIKNS